LDVTTFINVADLKDPNDPKGRTWREINNAKEHNIPVGTLVELENGVRLFVVSHNRDCDGTPLYAMSADPEDTKVEVAGFANRKWIHGYPEHCLEVVKRE
jgi:hypothetical protein